MAETGSAADQLLRLLYLLPAAAERPLSVAEAAERLGVSEETVVDDVALVIGRQYYHPAGSAEDVRVEIEADRIHVRSHGKFRRPMRLSPREALAAHLALRRHAAALDGPERERVLDVAARIGGGLSTAPPDEFVERFAVEEGGEPAGMRMGLRRAAEDRRRCRMVYVRSGGEGLSERTLDPYAVVASHGTWFVVGYCGLREDVRVFRLDRIVDLEISDDTFEVPDGFDLDDYVEEGRVFRADTTEPVTVRYTGLSAARVEEMGPTEQGPDGSVTVTYDVADPGWIVRHVLQQGGEAVVVEPEPVRREVARAAARLAGSEQPGA
ncbi:MAG TPA: WYL domain-containing protein [Gemmatimonadota bacterium]|nr:WYL domain-containing protein [Gemmatimonadota bacterium]